MASKKVTAAVFGSCLTLCLIVILTYILSIDVDQHSATAVSSTEWRLTEHKTTGWVLNDSVPIRQNAVTVVCMILTTPGSWYTKARAVLDTWAKRCHIPIFFYSRHAASTSHGIVNATHSVALDVPHGRRHISRMTMAGLRYSLKTYGDIADWFLKCDDDTYIVWENLLYLLGEHEAKSQVYLGGVAEGYLPHGFASGGAAYIVSKPAVRKIVDEGSKFPNDCSRDGLSEDVNVARCLARFDIYPSRTHGSDGRLRFHHASPYKYFTSKGVPKIVVGNRKRKEDPAMSNDTVSFHHLDPSQVYMFDFLLYRLNRHWRSASAAVTN